MSNVITIGLDLAKSVFQVCGLNRAGKVEFNRQVKRKQLMACLIAHPQALIAMEACGSAHYWGRRLEAAGLSVKLIPAQHVKAFTRGNKNDANDALGIAEAASRPNLHPVSVKSIAQQDIQTLMRIRIRHQHARTDAVNQLRGLLSEYGIVIPQGIKHIERRLPAILEDAENGLTAIAREGFYTLYQDYLSLSEQLANAEKTLERLAKANPRCRMLMRFRGVGVMTSLALFSAVGDPASFKNGRQFSAWLGLTPKHAGTGGKVVMGAMSKRGSSYLRTLLIHGARTVSRWLGKHDDPFSQWASAVVARRGKHKAIVAMANKNARLIGVALTKGIEFVPSYHLSPASRAVV